VNTFGTQIVLARRILDLRRQHRDHFVRRAIEGNRSSDDGGIGAEACPPERVTENHDTLAAREVFVRPERSAELGRHAECLEEPFRHAPRVEVNRIAASSEVQAVRFGRRELDGLDGLAPVQEIGWRRRFFDPLRLAPLPHREQAAGVTVRQRA
jgi:hypothetical protein